MASYEQVMELVSKLTKRVDNMEHDIDDINRDLDEICDDLYETEVENDAEVIGDLINSEVSINDLATKCHELGYHTIHIELNDDQFEMGIE